MIRLFSKLAMTALLAGSIAGQAQAHSNWRFPHKGTSYAAPHVLAKDGYVVRSQSECPRTVIIRATGKGPTTYVCPVK